MFINFLVHLWAIVTELSLWFPRLEYSWSLSKRSDYLPMRSEAWSWNIQHNKCLPLHHEAATLHLQSITWRWTSLNCKKLPQIAAHVPGNLVTDKLKAPVSLLHLSSEFPRVSIGVESQNKHCVRCDQVLKFKKVKTKCFHSKSWGSPHPRPMPVA